MDTRPALRMCNTTIYRVIYAAKYFGLYVVLYIRISLCNHDQLLKKTKIKYLQSYSYKPASVTTYS